MSQAPILPYDPATLAGSVAGIAAMPRLFRAGYVLDRLLCVVVMNGDGQETMSHLSARDAAAGATWACWMCSLLSVAVEADHCARTLAQGDTGKSAMWRAGLAMGAALLAAGFLADLILRAAWALALVGVHHVW